MKKTLILLEFRSIGIGFVYLDEITKNFSVKIEKCGLICPGKYIIICSGNQGEMDSLDKHLDIWGTSYEKNTITKILVSGVSLGILERINRPIRYQETIKSLGLAEFSNSVRAIEMGDFLEEENPVEIITIRIGVGMFNKSVILFQGDVSGVKNSVEKIKEKNIKELVNVELINSPTKDFLESFKI